jgi:peptide deformylase
MVIDLSVGKRPGDCHVFINPEIVETEGEITEEEGCLSIPDFVEVVTRPERVKLRYLDRNGAEREMWGEGLMARAMCHEIDHLQGTLFVDHLRGFKKDRILKKIAKLAKSGMWY